MRTASYTLNSESVLVMAFQEDDTSVSAQWVHLALCLNRADLSRWELQWRKSNSHRARVMQEDQSFFITQISPPENLGTGVFKDNLVGGAWKVGSADWSG